MKKISLKNVKEILTRKEMRVIAGGYNPACGGINTCTYHFHCSGCYCFNGYCVFRS